jgi:hypothetical protein
MSKMNPEIKARWVAALRSGEYTQGTAMLRSGTGCHCCLGVLTDLAVKAGVGEWGAEPECGAFYFGSDSAMLPEAVSKWAGFYYPARMGNEVEIDGCYDMLAGHNDGGIPFEKIADAIEAQL